MQEDAEKKPKEVNNMNYLKHSLHNITKLIVDAIKKGNVECYEDIHTSILTDNYIIDTIYEKDEVGVYIAEEWDWFGNGNDEYYDRLYISVCQRNT